MKVAYFGYDLLASCALQVEAAGHEVVHVFSFDTDGVTEHNDALWAFAVDRDIPFQTARVRREDLFALRDSGCELIVCAGYLYRIPTGILRGINIHPSLLPQGRGPWPMPWVILKGLGQSGVTLHVLEKAMDSGNILAQEAFPVSPRETLHTLTAKIQEAAPRLLFACLTRLDDAWHNARAQGEGSYWPEPAESDMTISSDMDIPDIDRVIRAFDGFGCFLHYAGGTVRLIKAECFADPQAGRPGQRIVQDGRIIYTVRGGYILAHEEERLYV